MLTRSRVRSELLFFLLLMTWQAVAAPIATEVPLENRDDTAEQAALETSLLQALETLTKNEDIAKTAVAEKLKASLQKYLLEYEFVGDEEAGWVLRSRFDGTALEEALAGQKQPLIREEVLFWLAYSKDSGKPRVVSRLGRERLVKTIRQAADAVGIKAVLPLYDLADQDQFGVEDIEMGYLDGIEKATGRYHVDSYLTGILSHSDKLWHVELEQYGLVSIGESPDLGRAMRMALNQLRQDAATLDAPVDAKAPLRIAVSDVRSWQDQRRAKRYLETLAGVVRVEPAASRGDIALFDIWLTGSEQAWLDRVASDGVLAASPGVTDAAHQFRLKKAEK